MGTTAITPPLGMGEAAAALGCGKRTLTSLIALRSEPPLSTCFAFDEMQEAAMLMFPLPGQPHSFRKPVTDNDVSIVQTYLQHAGLCRISRDVVHQAVDMRARELSFHPVRDYLEGLVWDETPRLTHWLETYLGAEPSPYVQGIGRMFMIAMCARIIQPGCKVDYMPVFEGPQGCGKSSACAIIGGDYYSDALPDVTSGKDVSQHLRGKWLVEVAELSALRRAEAAVLKAFFTRQVERYRPPYGRLEVIQPRQCCFIGTTNKSAYLRDETGGRRFWPVKVGRIDAGALAADRDQLFAEAKRVYDGGIPWWPDPQFEHKHILREQDARFDADVWEEAIGNYLATHDSVLVGSIARDALDIKTERIGRTEQNRITAVLQRRGWVRQRKDGRGNIAWKPGGIYG
jgi:predicted P-loop ATPase